MSATKRKPSPLDGLLPYQRAWVDDDSRFKIGLMARQTGKSWTSALEAVRDCRERKTTWVCLSAGERQALEWMMKAREHVDAFGVATGGIKEQRATSEALLKQAEIRFRNGSRLLAIPANPDTARGYSANLVLDEFAFHENPDAIWRAIYPSISNPLKGIFKIRVVSTPNGLGNKFADLWHKGEGWARHHVDIYEAVKAGLPVDLDELKRGLNDPEGWAQEYECQFLDAAAVLLPYDVIAKCESAEATTACPPEFWGGRAAPPYSGLSRAPGPLFIGWDFARKRDLSVPWVVELVGDVLHTRELIEFRGMSTPDQIDAMRHRIRGCTRLCLDYTGNGVGCGDYLVKEFGEYDPGRHQFGKVELCTFTNNLKVDIFSKLRMAFDSMKVRIPVNREVREDLHSIQRVATTSGTVTYRAPHTSDGHADRCTALALAVRAGGSARADFSMEII